MHKRFPVENLGEAAPYVPQVVVVDIAGIPFQNAVVSILQNGRQSFEVSTNAQGAADLTGVSTPFEIRVVADGYVVTKDVPNLEQTVFIQLPIHVHQGILSPIEIGLFVGAAASFGAGLYLKKDFLRTIGEVFFGTGVFSAVYRNSCGG